MPEYYSAPPMTKKEILLVSQRLRNVTATAEKPCFPVMEFLEYFLPMLDENFNYLVLGDQDMPVNTYAYYEPISGQIYIREDVYERACNGIARDRFTIAHEIGHFFLHHSGFALCREDSKKSIPTYCDPEWQANTFASFLLMPPNLIRNMSAEDIAKQCGTSLTAARIAKEKSQTLT